MPIGVRTPKVLSAANAQYDPGNWTMSQLHQSLECSTPDALLFECTEGDTAGRVIGMSLASEEVSGGASASLVHVRLSDTGTAITDLNNPLLTGSVGGAGVIIRRLTGRLAIDANPTPAAGPTVIASAGGVGVPVWSNGRRAWTDPFAIDADAFSTVGLRFPIGGVHALEKIYRVQFWIAGS
jgi:hypothetical protein